MDPDHPSDPGKKEDDAHASPDDRIRRGMIADKVLMGPVARVSSPTIGSSSTTLTNALMGTVFQITPIATDTLTTDFVLAAQEVSR